MKTAGLALLLILFVCAGCTQISLKRIDQDIPSVLVEKYQCRTTEYADAGSCFLFPLWWGSERVARTARGFQAYQHRNLGLLLADTTKYADYDQQGQLMRYGYAGSYFTPLIYKKRGEQIRVADGSRAEYSKKFLLGCFGSQLTTNGARILIVLWIPCPIPMYEESPY